MAHMVMWIIATASLPFLSYVNKISRRPTAENQSSPAPAGFAIPNPTGFVEKIKSGATLICTQRTEPGNS